MAQKDEDDSLGMNRPISRRAFMGGVAAGVASGSMFGSSVVFGNTQSAYYPPASTGLRGSHPGSFEVAHRLAFDSLVAAGQPTDDNELYDLVVVGGGISGLAAAYFYAQQAGPDVRILVLENHDDFGGHAKRNEFHYKGETIIGYGGSESMENPGRYSQTTKKLLHELKVDVSKFYTAYDRSFFDKNGLNGFVFFDRAHYGSDAMIPMSFDGEANARLKHEMNNVPMSDDDREKLVELLTGTVYPLADPFPDLDDKSRRELLGKISLEQFLREYRDCSDEVIHLLSRVSFDYWAIGIDGLSARDGYDMDFPGTMNLLKPSSEDEEDEPYIFHFPDGNATIARMLVKKLIPQIATADSMEEIVTAKFDYHLLDRPGQLTNIRLNSTVTHVAQESPGGEVDVTYSNGGKSYRVKARGCVLACYHRMIPHICPSLPEPQKEALQYGVRSPLVYTNVLIRNWRAMKKLGVGWIYCPNGLFHSIYIDFPVSLGSYQFSQTPDDPIVLSLAHIPYSMNTGLNPREVSKLGRQQLMGLKFEDYERAARQQLTAALGAGGFNAKEDIVAITVNQWPHGYAYEYISLWDENWIPGEAPNELARKKSGRISIAGSDAAASAYMDAAIDEAHRAVSELL
jgi:spermidine dehydrogenase